MNLRFVFKLVGRVELMVAASLLLPLAVALFYGESPWPFVLTMGLILCVCAPLARMSARPVFFQREGFVIVGLIWVVTCLFGSLPFWFSGCFASFVDCLFEASSGFTTTGATILPDIEILPRGIQFWRCFTHWLGGMGVLVLATAVFPSLGARSQYLTRAETPGPMVVKLVPKQAKTSKILYGIYCAMTLAVIALLWGAGMPLYDAAVHAFSIAGTGGFSSRNASFAAYPLPGVDLIVATATLLFSLNFGLFFLALRRREERGAALLSGGGGTGHRAHRLGSGPGLPPGGAGVPAVRLLPCDLRHLHQRLFHRGLRPVAPVLPDGAGAAHVLRLLLQFHRRRHQVRPGAASSAPGCSSFCGFSAGRCGASPIPGAWRSSKWTAGWWRAPPSGGRWSSWGAIC